MNESNDYQIAFSVDSIDKPIVNCTETTATNVAFEWTDVGVVSYQIVVKVNGIETDNFTTNALTFDKTGLKQEDKVTISVTAIALPSCGDSEAGTASCIAQDCPALTLSIEGLAENYCIGDTAVTLTAILEGNPSTGGSFIGSAISEGNQLNPGILQGGFYLISYVYNESNGCQYIAEESLLIGGIEGQIIGGNTPITLGKISPLEVNAFSATGGNLTYEWSPVQGLDCTDCASVNASPTQTTTYDVLVSDLAGCSRVFSTTVRVIGENKLMMPSAFSPNGDGNNDVYVPYVQGWEKITFQVFSRWGEKIHDVTATDTANIGWDGMIENRPALMGSYVYVVIVTYFNGSEELKRGHFQLLR
ncbi:MAG: gliding motility-associated C-terminal domain-containing protein [Chitinophagales bacterium]